MRGILVSDAILAKLYKDYKSFNNADKINLKKFDFSSYTSFVFDAGAIEKKILNKNFNDTKKTRESLKKKYHQNVLNIKPRFLKSKEKEEIGFVIASACLGWYATSMKQVKKMLVEEYKSLDLKEEIKKIAEVAAIVVFMFKNNSSDNIVKKYILENYGYKISSCDDNKIKVKENVLDKIIAAICIVMETCKFEEAINLAFEKYKVDTTILLTGIFAQAYFQKIPPYLIKRTNKVFPKHLKDLAGRLENIVFDN